MRAAWPFVGGAERVVASTASGLTVLVESLPGAHPHDLQQRLDRVRALGDPRFWTPVEVAPQRSGGGSVVACPAIRAVPLVALMGAGVPPSGTVEVVAQALEALGVASAAGHAMTTVTGSDLLVTPEGAVVVAGLVSGPARFAEHPPFVGRRAPELLQGHPPGPQADVYSMGVVLWELLAERGLFGDGRPVPEVLVSPPPLGRQDVPPALEAIVRACLAFDPAQRPDLRQLPGMLRGALGSPVIAPATTMQRWGARALQVVDDVLSGRSPGHAPLGIPSGGGSRRDQSTYLTGPHDKPTFGRGRPRESRLERLLGNPVALGVGVAGWLIALGLIGYMLFGGPSVPDGPLLRRGTPLGAGPASMDASAMDASSMDASSMDASSMDAPRGED